MPPRKPKQPARKSAPKKAATKKAATKKADTPSFNPETHILCDDGKVYERKIVQATGVSVGVNRTEKPHSHVELEQKMVQAIQQAHADGISDPDEIRDRILKVREDHLNG